MSGWVGILSQLLGVLAGVLAGVLPGVLAGVLLTMVHNISNSQCFSKLLAVSCVVDHSLTVAHS